MVHWDCYLIEDSDGSMVHWDYNNWRIPTAPWSIGGGHRPGRHCAIGFLPEGDSRRHSAGLARQHRVLGGLTGEFAAQGRVTTGDDWSRGAGPGPVVSGRDDSCSSTI